MPEYWIRIDYEPLVVNYSGPTPDLFTPEQVLFQGNPIPIPDQYDFAFERDPYLQSPVLFDRIGDAGGGVLWYATFDIDDFQLASEFTPAEQFGPLVRTTIFYEFLPGGPVISEESSSAYEDYVWVLFEVDGPLITANDDFFSIDEVIVGGVIGNVLGNDVSDDPSSLSVAEIDFSESGYNFSISENGDVTLVSVDASAIRPETVSVNYTLNGPGSEPDTGSVEILLPPAIAQIRELDAVVTEGDSGRTFVQFEVYLDTPVHTDVSFDWEVVYDGNTRVNQQDIVAGARGTVTVLAGQRTALIEISVAGEAKPELDELLEIRLTENLNDPQIIALGDSDRASSVILNDDGEYTWENVAQWMYQNEQERIGPLIRERDLPGMSTDTVLRDVERYYTGRQLAEGQDLGYTLGGTIIAPFYDLAKLGALSLDELFDTDSFGRFFSLLSGGSGNYPSPPGGLDIIFLGFVDGIRARYSDFSITDGSSLEQSTEIEDPELNVPLEQDPPLGPLLLRNFVPDGDQDNFVLNVAESETPLSIGGGNDFVVSTTTRFISSGAGNDFVWASLAPSTVQSGEGDDVVFGSDFSDLLYLGPGNDVVLPGLGADEVFLGEGSNVVRGRLADLDGDQIHEFSSDDTIIIEGEALSNENLTVSLGSAILEIDTDLDGLVDSVTTLIGNYEQAEFYVEVVEGNTLITANIPDAPQTIVARIDFVEARGRDKAVYSLDGVDLSVERLRYLQREVELKEAGVTIGASDGLRWSPDYITTAGKGIGIWSAFGDLFSRREKKVVDESETLSFDLDNREGLSDAVEVSFEFAKIIGSGLVDLFFFDEDELVQRVELAVEDNEVSFALPEGETFDRVELSSSEDLQFAISAVEFHFLEEDTFQFI